MSDSDDRATVSLAEPEGPADPGDAPGRPRRRWRPTVAAVSLVALLLAGSTLVFAGVRQPVQSSASRSGAPQGQPPPPPPGTPYQQAVFALRRHAAALVDGDESGWLQAVDPGQPALQTRYRGMYDALRALGVTRFEYTPESVQGESVQSDEVTFPTRAWYCFGTDTCRGDGDRMEPELRMSLTMRPVGGRYVITEAVDQPDPHYADPPPWADGDLVVRQGSRVVIAADPSEAGYVSRVLPLAESAALAVDRTATAIDASQARYRIFLAGEREWKDWYGGTDDQWALGESWHVSAWGTDVVIRVRAISGDDRMRATIAHELGHVVTLSGATDLRDADNWLGEGVAEYIAAGTPRLAGVRTARLTSMVPADPGPRASTAAGDAFFGLSHLAVNCLAGRYGEAKMYRFAHDVLIQNDSYDEAARAAFGTSFAAVDTTCTTWIRQQL